MACSRKQPAAVVMWGREGLGDMGKPLAVIKLSLVAIFRTVQPSVLFFLGTALSLVVAPCPARRSAGRRRRSHAARHALPP
jgi:hypothetical protein